MLILTVKVEGLQRMIQNLGQANVERAVSLATKRSAEKLRDDTKLLPPVSAKTTGYEAEGIPVDTSRMRNAIHTFDVALFAAGVIADVGYSGYVRDGTANMPGRDFFAFALQTGTREKIKQIYEDYLAKAVNGTL
jgi:hypothetical protein